MPIRDSLLDAVGFGGAGQLAHQLEGKRDSAAEAVAGGDAAVYNDFLIVDDGTGQLVLKSGVGYASEAIKKVMSLAFYDLHLHRVFARVMPENKPSIYLLESLGFQYEGVERGCFFIQNRWADHLRYAYLNPSTDN